VGKVAEEACKMSRGSLTEGVSGTDKVVKLRKGRI
jgi:hypothetical protein